MPTQSKKHHYVPKAQLAHFSIDGRGKQIWVFDKQDERVWPSSLIDAGSENQFNTVELEGEAWNFEDVFADVDDRSGPLLSKIVAERSLAWLDPERHMALLDLFATQMLRTHLARSTPRQIALQLRKIIQGLGYDPDLDPSLAVPDEKSVRLGALQQFLRRGEIVKSLTRLYPALFSTPERTSLLLSDHPVVISNAYPYGDPVLDAHGVIVLLPVSPDLAVALLCPTIISRYDPIDTIEMSSEQRLRMEAYRSGFRSRLPIQIEPAEVTHWNRRQVGRSRRYLYSAYNDFELARELLKENEELRNVDTHMFLGGLGRPPPARPGMPSGLQLVVKGRHDTCVLRIIATDDRGEGLTAQTLDIELLNQVVKDPNEVSVELYHDGQSRRSVSAVCLEPVEEGTGWFRVVHRDPSLRALMRQLDANRKG